MRENNRQEIAKSSRDYFECGMYGHSAVHSLTNEGDDTYLIERTSGRHSITIAVADIYIMGEADVFELKAQHNGIDAIVLIGFYNKYSQAAKKLAKNRGIGLFTHREFWGAIHYSGNKFVNYEKPDKEDTYR